MKAMFAGFAASLLIAVGAWAALHNIGFSSPEKYSGANVRLD